MQAYPQRVKPAVLRFPSPLTHPSLLLQLSLHSSAAASTFILRLSSTFAMASTCASLVAPVAAAKVAAPAKQTSFNGLARMPLNKVAKNSFASKTVSNGIKTRQMLVWQPTDNKWVASLDPADSIAWRLPHFRAVHLLAQRLPALICVHTWIHYSSALVYCSHWFFFNLQVLRDLLLPATP